MLQTTSLNNVRFQEGIRFERIREKQVRLIALLFCRPEMKLMQTDIIPSLEYFHRRSGGTVAFYFGGFESDLEAYEYATRESAVIVIAPSDQPGEVVAIKGDLHDIAADGFVSIKGPGRKTWYFLPESFNHFRREVEQQTRWRYSGGCDMILLDSRRDGESYAKLDFSTAMVLRLDTVSGLTAASTVSQLFEMIFQYAEAQNDANPTWGLSDHLGVQVAREGLWQAIISWLPQAVQSSVNSARQLIAQDIAGR